jgi:hypothetical protein
VKGRRVHEEQLTVTTVVRHPKSIESNVAMDFKKAFMQRPEVKHAAILPEEVEVHAQLLYS